MTTSQRRVDDRIAASPLNRPLAVVSGRAVGVSRYDRVSSGAGARRAMSRALALCIERKRRSCSVWGSPTAPPQLRGQLVGDWWQAYGTGTDAMMIARAAAISPASVGEALMTAPGRHRICDLSMTPPLAVVQVTTAIRARKLASPNRPVT